MSQGIKSVSAVGLIPGKLIFGYHALRIDLAKHAICIPPFVACRDIAKVRVVSVTLGCIEYYEQITKNMVDRVLTKNRGITEKDNEIYRVKGFTELSKIEVDALIARCDAKIAEYLDKRSDPWSHRRKSTGYIPGTQRYEVLKRARFRCELCGVSADYKAIEVDHIIPRNKGGTDDTSNLQALCYSCNLRAIFGQ